MLSIREDTSIFDTEANILVNPVNCVGVCGAGLALTFRERYPENYTAYRKMCVQDKMRTGKIFITYNNDPDGLAIYNFPSKKHWKHKSERAFIIDGLLDMKNHLNAGDVVGMPLVGCGLGGLPSVLVISWIKAIIGNIPDVEIVLCTPRLNHLAELL